jgi:hypothetical protein
MRRGRNRVVPFSAFEGAASTERRRQIASPVPPQLFHYRMKMDQSLIHRGTPLLIEPLRDVFGLRFGEALGTEHNCIMMRVPDTPAVGGVGQSNDIAILHRSLCTGFSQITAE